MYKKPYLSLGEAIEAFLEKHGLKDDVKIQRVITDWERLMGTPIAQNTEKIWFNKGILYIKVISPVWKNELQMARQKIRETVNREVRAEIVKEVRVF